MGSDAVFSRMVICNGKSCRKRKKSYEKLCKLFPSAKKRKCMGICKGPVLHVKVEKKSFLFFKIRKKKDRVRLEKFLRTGRRSKKLKARKV